MMAFVPWSRPRRPAAADDATLLGRLAAGDAAALDLLYRREAGPVYRYALALCSNAAWAADATHEAFMALATRPTSYDASRGALGAWLAGVARHALAATWREGRLCEPLPDDDGPFDAISTGAAAHSPEALLVQVQDSAEVWAALRALPAPFREALVLVDLQERPYAEAAQIAGIQINTLRTRLHRARHKLAALLGATAGSLR